MLPSPRNKRQVAGWIGVWGCLVLLPLCQQLFFMLPSALVYDDNNNNAPATSTLSSMSRRNQHVETNHSSPSHPNHRPDGLSIALPSLRKQRAEPSPSHEEPGKISIAVATTITGCSEKFPMDGAAILQYSILNATSSTSRYRFHFYAIYHPNATKCAQSLGTLGYTLLEREGPVRVSEIQNRHFREILPKTGASSMGHWLSPVFACSKQLTWIVRSCFSCAMSPLRSSRVLRREGAAEVRGVSADTARRGYSR
jgi:hypothetical protein